MESTAVNVKTKWAINPSHSEIAFKVKHLMISNVKGFFKEFEAEIISNGEDFLNAEVKVIINASSIDTSEPQRDGHLKSADFFDVEKHKQIVFQSTSAKKSGSDGNYELIGNLTIKDITKSIKLEVEPGGIMKDPWGNIKAGFNISGKINRKDWGLNWNAALEAGGVLVGDEVRISCEIELLKQ